MLAGRILLLADDSITIQKVVALTFADEGVQVITVGNGTEAIEKLEEISPDVVLADVFMPGMTGYQVCEHIKQNARLKHIPVMLLIGSFEPFDEAEAHRVGADDTLTKPFQSIRNLVERVGGLLRGKTAAPRLDPVAPDPPAAEVAVAEISPVDPDEAMTAELPRSEMVEPESHPISSDELELMTADTLQMAPEMLAATELVEVAEDSTIRVDLEEKMETETHTAAEAKREAPLDFGDVLLDLGLFEPASVFGTDDAILDLGLDVPVPEMLGAVKLHTAVAEVESAPVAKPEAAVAEPFVDTLEWETVSETRTDEVVEFTVVEETTLTPELVAEFAQDFEQPAVVQQVAAEPAASAPATPAGQITLDQLSPEAIDAIARRVVAQLSEKAVQEIAWEVVPQLAELLIKRRLEEKETQAH